MNTSPPPPRPIRAPLLPTPVALCVALLSVVLLGCMVRPAVVDGSKWTINPDTGQPEKVGTWDHDAAGNVINRKGDTEGVPARPAPSGKQAAQDGLRGAAKTVGVIAGLLLLASVAGVVASFFIPWLPRSTAIKAFAISLVLFFVQYWLNRYGEGLAVWSFWICLLLLAGSAFAFGWPWIVTLYNRNRERAGRRLAAEGDPRAGTALVITARPDEFKTPEARKALLNELSLGVNGAGGAA